MADITSEKINRKPTWGGGVSPFKVSYGKIMMWFFLVSDALTFGGLLVAYGYARHTYLGIWPAGEEVFHAFPLMGHTYLPLLYVAFMTFILIVSSVTMVLAVEAGHRMDKRGVVKWLGLTIVGGFIFLSSQAWEWSHFIHGGGYGKVLLEDGSYAKVKSEHDEIKNLFIVEAGGKYEVGDKIKGEKAVQTYETIKEETPEKIIHGANMQENEYGPKQYANFFFFITGFHGFHVFSGVLINLIIFFGVIRGVYHKKNHYEMVEKIGLYWHFVDLVWVFVFTFFYLV